MPLAVVFCLPPTFLEATERSYGFILKGFQETELLLMEKSIPFFLLLGTPEIEIPKFVSQYKVTKLVTDFNPLNIIDQYKSSVAKKFNSSFYEVDAHNIVPARVASEKQEFGAYTIRPKIHRLLPEFLDDFPKVRKHPFDWNTTVPRIDWKKSNKSLQIDRTVTEVEWIKPGENSAQSALNDFLKNRLQLYNNDRNDPTINGQSNLSPYLHFGHLAPQRVALEVIQLSGKNIQDIVQKKKNGSAIKPETGLGNEEAFLEELIIRREIADNFTYYNKNYDSFEGFPAWAQLSINQHRNDKREYLYTVDQFEQAQTHDELWNAAQNEMVFTGKMHGYMRMYWAKKILEWTPSPEEALMIGNYLNDKYELDGRDPNGYTGMAWSIGGVHDRAWFERPVFGKIRYMNYNGCKNKFNVTAYIERIQTFKKSK